MIGRADIEGSKSNVAMGAWLPQASSLIPRSMMQAFPQALTSSPLGVTVNVPLLTITLSGGSSMYLRPRRTHTLPCVEPLSVGVASDFTRVGCWSSNPLNCLPYSSKYCTMGCYRHRLAFRALRTFQHPGVSLVMFSWSLYHYSREGPMPNTDIGHCLTWQRGGLVARDW